VVEGQQKLQKAQAAAADREVNVATGTNEVLLPDVELPGGITNSLRDYKERSRQGNDWRSELFGLGSAAPSNNVPSSPEVTRKPHGVNEGGVRNTSTNGSTAQVPATTNGTSGSGITIGTSVFSNNLEQGYSNQGTPVGAEGPVASLLDKGKAPARTNGGSSNGNTTLGANNAVLTGQATEISGTPSTRTD